MNDPLKSERNAHEKRSERNAQKETLISKNDETRVFFSQIFFVFYNKEIFFVFQFRMKNIRRSLSFCERRIFGWNNKFDFSHSFSTN